MTVRGFNENVNYLKYKLKVKSFFLIFVACMLLYLSLVPAKRLVSLKTFFDKLSQGGG